MKKKNVLGESFSNIVTADNERKFYFWEYFANIVPLSSPPFRNHEGLLKLRYQLIYDY
jgi:hypothetical protein